MEGIFIKVPDLFPKSVKTFSTFLRLQFQIFFLEGTQNTLKNSIAARSLRKRELERSPANLHSRIIQKAECCRKKFEEKKLEDVVVERQRTKRVTWKTKNVVKEGEKFYFSMERLLQLS